MDETREELTEAEKLERFKAMKREAAQRHQEKVKKLKAEAVELAKQLIETLKNSDVWNNLSDKTIKWLTDQATPVTPSSNSPIFSKMFGASPAVGDSITLFKAIELTLKGKSNIDKAVKTWEEKGIIVEFVNNEQNLLESTYVIRALPNM